MGCSGSLFWGKSPTWNTGSVKLFKSTVGIIIVHVLSQLPNLCSMAIGQTKPIIPHMNQGMNIHEHLLFWRELLDFMVRSIAIFDDQHFSFDQYGAPVKALKCWPGKAERRPRVTGGHLKISDCCGRRAAHRLRRWTPGCREVAAFHSSSFFWSGFYIISTWSIWALVSGHLGFPCEKRKHLLSTIFDWNCGARLLKPGVYVIWFWSLPYLAASEMKLLDVWGSNVLTVPAWVSRVLSLMQRFCPKLSLLFRPQGRRATDIFALQFCNGVSGGGWCLSTHA